MALKNRMLSINPDAAISQIDEYLTSENIDSLDIYHGVAINALDFSTDAPFLFDEKCTGKGIPVIHPYNVGWAGFVFVISKESQKIRTLGTDNKVFELDIGAFIKEAIKKDGHPVDWFDQFLKDYENAIKDKPAPPPQLSIGVNLLSGMVAQIIMNIAINEPIRLFPNYYYLSIHH